MVVLDSSMVPHPTAGKVKNDDKKHGDRNGVERVKGIEPSSQAWEARILPLNHTRVDRTGAVVTELKPQCNHAYQASAFRSPGETAGRRQAIGLASRGNDSTGILDRQTSGAGPVCDELFAR